MHFFRFRGVFAHLINGWQGLHTHVDATGHTIKPIIISFRKRDNVQVLGSSERDILHISRNRAILRQALKAVHESEKTAGTTFALRPAAPRFPSPRIANFAPNRIPPQISRKWTGKRNCLRVTGVARYLGEIRNEVHPNICRKTTQNFVF